MARSISEIFGVSNTPISPGPLRSLVKPQTNVPPPLPLKRNFISPQDKFLPSQPNIYDERLSTLAPRRQIDKEDIKQSAKTGVAFSLPGVLSPPIPLKQSGLYEKQMKSIRDEDYQPQTGLGKAAKVIAREGGNLPLWLAGEGAILAAGRKLFPQVTTKGAPLAKKALLGGTLDATTYGGVVAPAETLMEGGGLKDFADKAKFAPLVGAGGSLLRGVGGGLAGKSARPQPPPLRPSTLPNPKQLALPEPPRVFYGDKGQIVPGYAQPPKTYNPSNLDSIGKRVNARDLTPQGLAKIGETKPLQPLPKLTQQQLAKNEFGLNDLDKLSKLPKAEPKPLNLNKAADDFRSKIDRNPAKKKTFSESIKNIRTQFVDDVAPLEKLEKSVTGKVASAEDSLYKQARLFRGSPERANNIIETELSPVIKALESKGYSYKDLGDYALAVHAKDVNAKGIVSGFSKAEIDGVIAKYSTPEMEAARKQLIKISDNLLQDLTDSGVISKEMLSTLREKWPNYMPLFRSFDDEKIEFARGVSKALVNVSSPLKKLEGSKRAVVDPIENMVKNIFKSSSAADRNKVATKLSRLADMDKKGEFVRKLAKDEPKERINTVFALENGEKVYYEVQPDVYKALLNLDKESSNLLIKILQKPASVLRAGATLTPEFSFRNPMRDIVQAYVVSKSGFNPVTDVFSAIWDIAKSKVLKKETDYNKFMKDLGGFGNIVSMDRKAHQDAIQKIITQPASQKAVNIVSGKSFIKLLRSIADVSETATKLGEYKAAIRSGASGPEAAYRARDLMDFARAGSSVREANKIVAFLNANIQGKSKIIRAIKENPIGATTRAVQSITLPSVGVFMAQKYLANEEQQRTIQDAPNWLKNTFWLVPVPNTNSVARIPKPFDLAPIFSNLPEKVMESIYAQDTKAFDDFAKTTLGEFSIPVMMTGMLPFIEGMANYSFFRQGPIIPQREQNINYPDQFDINTTEAAKFVGKGVNALTGGQGPFKNFGSPRVIDNTIRGTTAGLGQYATSAIDLIVENTGVAEKETKPAKGLSQMPVLKSFLVNDMSTGKAMDQLYTLKETLTNEKGSAKLKGSTLQPKDLIKLEKAEETTDAIAKINKKMREIENSKRLNKEIKRKQLLDLNRQRNDFAIEAMKRINQIK